MQPLDEIDSMRDVFKEIVQFEQVNEYLVKMAGGLDVSYPMEYPELPEGSIQHPLLGFRLPNIPINIPSGQTDIATLLRTGHGMLLNLSAETAWTGEFSAWASQIEIVNAEYTPKIDAAVLLVRPDGRVAWAGDKIDDFSGLHASLAKWFGLPITEGAS